MDKFFENGLNTKDKRDNLEIYEIKYLDIKTGARFSLKAKCEKNEFKTFTSWANYMKNKNKKSLTLTKQHWPEGK